MKLNRPHIKPMTEHYLAMKHIKSWKLFNNGILEYGNWIIEETAKQIFNDIEGIIMGLDDIMTDTLFIKHRDYDDFKKKWVE